MQTRRPTVIGSSTFYPHYSAMHTGFTKLEHSSTVFDELEMYTPLGWLTWYVINVETGATNSIHAPCILPTIRATWGCWVQRAENVYQPQRV